MIDWSRVRWSQLRIGVIVTVATLLACVVIFFIDDVRGAVENRYTLYFHTFTTQTLSPQAPVWLAGQQVGFIRGLQFEPPSRDRGELLRVELSIGEEVQTFITEGAMAQVTTAGLLGQAVVNILPADRPGPPLPNEGVLLAAPELDLFQVSESMQMTYDSLPSVLGRWADVLDAMRRGQGTLARLARRPDQVAEFRDNLNGVTATMNRARRVADGFAELLRDPQVRTSLDRLGPRLRRLADQISGAEGTVGRLAADSVLKARLVGIAQRAARVSQRLETGRGTLGRALHDEVLADELARTRDLLNRLRSDLSSARRGRPPR